MLSFLFLQVHTYLYLKTEEKLNKERIGKLPASKTLPASEVWGGTECWALASGRGLAQSKRDSQLHVQHYHEESQSRGKQKTEQDLGTEQSSKPVRWMLNYFSSDKNKLKQKPNNLEFKTKNKNVTKNATTNHGNGDKRSHDFSWKAWKRQQPPTKSKTVSVDATQRHIEKYTGQKGGNKAVGLAGQA